MLVRTKRHLWCSESVCLLPRSCFRRAPCLKKTRPRFITASASGRENSDRGYARGIPVWDDTDVDAMAVTTTDLDPLERARRTRAGAFKALYGYPYSDFRRSIYVGSTRKTMSSQTVGKEYLSKMLDKVGIQVSVANAWPWTTSEHPRFRFVFSSIRLCFPFDNKDLTINPDRAVFFPIQEKACTVIWRRLASRSCLPTLQAMRPALAGLLADKQQNGVAIKFEARIFGPRQHPRIRRRAAEGSTTNITRAVPLSAQDYLLFRTTSSAT